MGKGNHSENGIPVLGPEVQRWLKKNNYYFEDEEDNPGCIIVFLIVDISL